MSESKKSDPIDPVRRADGARGVDAVPPARPGDAPQPVAGVGSVTRLEPAGAVVASIASRLERGELDRAQAVRALVASVIEHELDGLDASGRVRVIDEVAELLAAEPGWQARLDDLWRSPPR